MLKKNTGVSFNPRPYLYTSQQILRNLNQVVTLNGLVYIYNPSAGYYTRVAAFVKYPRN